MDTARRFRTQESRHGDEILNIKCGYLFSMTSTETLIFSTTHLTANSGRLKPEKMRSEIASDIRNGVVECLNGE
jgi:hypothetical protein